MRRGEQSWFEVTVSPGTLAVAERKMTAGEDPRRYGLGHPDVYDMVPDDDFETRQTSFEDLARTRGEIREWSPRSRARMLYRLATIDWDTLAGIAEMLTLTYPGLFPVDGPTCKRHLAAFRKRHERQWGYCVGAWKFEFQRRGAPHFHLLMFRPAHVPWRDYKDWCARSWYEIVGSGDPRHLRAGVGVDRETFRRAGKKSTARRLAWYFAKHSGPGRESRKAFQNDVPVGFESCGRFWGVWGVQSAEETTALIEDEAHALRRILRGYRQSVQTPASCGVCSMDAEPRRVLVALGDRLGNEAALTAAQAGPSSGGVARSQLATVTAEQLGRHRKGRCRGRRKIKAASITWSLLDQPYRVLVQAMRLGRIEGPRYVHWTGETDRVRSWPPGRPRPLP